MTIDQTQLALTRLLDATAFRHRVLANNLANADTPGFIRQEVPFESELADAVRNGDLTDFKLAVAEDRTAAPRADGNNVQIDHELSEINKNALLHQMAVQLMQAKLSMQRTAITGRA
jgi:flagellar basal-body rod protein FlgB